MSPRRVVVTGLGVVSPLGCGTGLAWERLLSGRSGVVRLPDAMVPDVPSKVGGLVPTVEADPEGGLDLGRFLAAGEARRSDRFIHLAIAAAEEALAQAGWRPADAEGRESTATVVGTAIGGMNTLVEAAATVSERGARRLGPFAVPAIIANLAAGQLSIRHGFGGPIGTPVTACAAGIQAVGDAARLIRSGEAEVALAGGSEACLGRVSLAAFAAARALSTARNDEPARASRPFDRDRDGFVMSEGAAMLVLESLDHALGRGAHPLAEVAGYGASADAHHVTGPPEDGAGALRAMRAALRQAGAGAPEVGHVSAHATSTPAGDAAELAALRALFGEGPLPGVSAVKGATGHLMGAAGALAACFAVMALRTGMLPPTLNLKRADWDGGGLVGLRAVRADPVLALVNGFGFGGVNACLALRRYPG